MKVLPFDVFPQDGLVDFETILRESDIITLHVPLTPDTRNMIGASELKKMKRSAILINTARGGLVDEAALAAALRDGEIAGAGFDVLTEEPPRNGNVLLDPDNPKPDRDATRGLGKRAGDADSGRPAHRQHRSVRGR